MIVQISELLLQRQFRERKRMSLRLPVLKRLLLGFVGIYSDL